MKTCPHCGGSGNVPDVHGLTPYGRVVYEAVFDRVQSMAVGAVFAPKDLMPALSAVEPPPTVNQFFGAIEIMKRHRKLRRVGHGQYQRIGEA